MATTKFDDIKDALDAYISGVDKIADLQNSGNDLRNYLSDDKATNEAALALDLVDIVESFVAHVYPTAAVVVGANASPRRADSLAVRRMNHQSHYF